MKAYKFLSIFLLLSIASYGQYQGGIGHGSNQGAASTFLDGQELSSLFSGSNGDGFNSVSYSSFLSGQSLAHIYGGGSDDGFSSKGNASFLDGNSLSQLYSGGSADGFDNTSSSSFLDGTSLSLMFNGGVSDGFDESSYSSFLDGSSLSSLFSGGVGDGFGREKESQFLNGQDLSLIFAGGAGDGFSIDGAYVVSQSLAYALWTGLTSTDWQTPTNWYSSTVPLNSENVVIDESQNHHPVLDIDVITQDLDILTGATVEVAGGNSLTVQGDLEIADTEGLTLSSTTSSTGYSQLLVEGIQLGPGTIKGEFYVGNNAGFRHISSPLVTSFNDLVVGTNLLVASNSPQGNLFEWNAKTATWQAPNSILDNFSVGKGYNVFIGTNAFGTFVASLPSKIDLNGQLQSTGDVNIVLGYNIGLGSIFFPQGTIQALTEGWNLIGNPYSCTYNWDNQTFPTGMTNKGIATWDPMNGRYAYYNNGTSINGGSQYIAPYQGVFVQTTAETVFTFEEENRTVSHSPSLKKTIEGQILLTVNGEDNQQFSDETLLAFKHHALDQFEGDKDMWKFLNKENIPSLYTIESGQPFAINHLKSFENSRSVSLGFETKTNGGYVINSDLNNFDPSYFVELEDVLLDKFYDLRKGDYAFTHNQSNRNDRFIIHINKKGTQIEHPEKRVLIFSSNNEIVIDFSQALIGAKKIKVYDVVGRELASVEAEMNDERIEIPISGRTNSYYVVKITSSYWTLAEKVFLIE